MQTTVFRKTAILPLVDGRPSLFDLWSRYKFHSGMLAIKAKVPPGTVQAMLCNQPIPRDFARNILIALSELVHKDYTLQSVYVALAD